MELDNNYVNLAAFLIVIVLGGFLLLWAASAVIGLIGITGFHILNVFGLILNWINKFFRNDLKDVSEYLKNNKSGVNNNLSSEEIVKKLQALKSDSPVIFGELKETEINVVPVTKNEKLKEMNYVDDNWRLVGLLRHNTNCDYFKSKNAVSCGSRDGVACKICGG